MYNCCRTANDPKRPCMYDSNDSSKALVQVNII